MAWIGQLAKQEWGELIAMVRINTRQDSLSGQQTWGKERGPLSGLGMPACGSKRRASWNSCPQS